jgi:hypothetical protein
LICFEGLLETNHPYNFAAKQCIKEMLLAEGSYDKIAPIISKLAGPLRLALACDIGDVFTEAIEITEMVMIIKILICLVIEFSEGKIKSIFAFNFTAN